MNKIILVILIASCGMSAKSRRNSVTATKEDLSSSKASTDIPAAYLRDDVPDLTQTDLSGNETGDGQQYCAPVAASNTLMWLAQHGYKSLIQNGSSKPVAQLEIAKLLGDKDHMSTSLDEGTNPSQVLLGLKKYLAARDLTAKRFTFQGWRNLVYKFESSGRIPELGFIHEGLVQNSIVLLNIGWYTHDAAGAVYHRDSGHWVTLVGYESGKSETLIIHDPSPRSGQAPTAHSVKLKLIQSGTLEGKNTGLPFSANGYFELSDDLKKRRGSDTAILDGVVVVQL